VNHANANAARPALDQLLEWTVRDLPETLNAAARTQRPK
jgi:hypothetical protein